MITEEDRKTLKRELIDYGREYGWYQHLRTMDFPESLMLVRTPLPSDPRGMTVRVEFDWATATKIEAIDDDCRHQIGGGMGGVKTYLRQNGWTA